MNKNKNKNTQPQQLQPALTPQTTTDDDDEGDHDADGSRAAHRPVVLRDPSCFGRCTEEAAARRALRCIGACSCMRAHFDHSMCGRARNPAR
eukprot:COSAG01_NODE_1119_length_11633_cov_4.612190_7_plen_92_part_00